MKTTLRLSIAFYLLSSFVNTAFAQTDAINIVPSGNVGIGTTAAAAFKLQVAGDAGPNADITFNLGSPALRWNNLYVNSILGPGALWTASGTHIYNSNSGNVGIGVASPTASKLQVAGFVSGDNAGSFSTKWSGDNHHGIWYRAGVSADGTTVSVADAMTFREYGSASLGYHFWTGGTTMTERFRITNNYAAFLTGNVGIATATTNNRMEFMSDNSAQALQFNTSSYVAADQWGTRIYKSDIGGGIPLKFQTQSASTWYDGVDLDHGLDNAHPSLKTYNNTQLATAGGNVGVGITAPLGKLDVQGPVARTGTHATSPSFYVTGSLNPGQTGPASGNVEFRHDNGTQGIGFGYNTIYQTGSNTNQELNLLSRGTGHITLNAFAYSTGNVGIGLTSPSEKLEVSGAIKMPGASATDNNSPALTLVSDDDFLYDGEYINHYAMGFHQFNDGAGLGWNTYASGYYGIDLFTGGAQRFRINNNGTVKVNNLAGTGTRFVVADASGNLSATSSTSSGVVTGSGVANRVAYWNGANTLTGSGQFLYAGENLSVYDAETSTGEVRLGAAWGRPGVYSSSQLELFSGGSYITFGNANTEYMRLTAAGSLGIGSTAPNQKLDVVGAIRSTDYHFINHSSPSIIFQDSDERSGVIHVNSNLMYFLSGNGTNGTGWSINGSYWPLYLNLNSDEAYFGGPAYFMEGSVGIGNNSPGYRLHVSGDIYANGGWFRVSGSQGLYFESYGTGIRAVQPDGGQYGSVSSYGSVNGWNGYSCAGRYVLMSDGAQNIGLYNDVDNAWLLLLNRLATNDNYIFYNPYDYHYNMRIQHTNGHNYASYDGDNNWDFYSDRRLKENIVNEENILDRLLNLDVVNYDYIEEELTEAEKEKGIVHEKRKYKEIGFIAQEVEKYFPSIVSESDDPRYDFKVKALGYSSFGVLAVGAIKELKIEKDKEIAELKAEIEKLRSLNTTSSENAQLKSEIAELKKMMLELEKKVNPSIK